MLLPDPNVLVYAHRKDAPDHAGYAAWLNELVQGSEPFAMSEMGLATFLRIVTHPRYFVTPSPTVTAMEFLDQVTSRPGCRMVRPGPRPSSSTSFMPRWPWNMAANGSPRTPNMPGSRAYAGAIPWLNAPLGGFFSFLG